MAENLKAGELPLSKVFSAEYDYFIPSYQRPYSWTVNEAGTLFDDLYDFWKTQPENETYFLGSIVLVKQENKPSSEVIDGQQRLTTLTILLAVLSRCFTGQPEAKGTLKSCLWEQGNIFLGIEAKPRLRLRERDADFFEKYILNEKFDDLNALNEKALPDSQRMLRGNAGLMCRNVSEKLSDPKETLGFVSFILQRCYMVVVTTPNTQSAFRVFSVLNNRGLSLLPSDIIKADIIGKIGTSSQKKYTEKWDDMEETLGRDGFNALLSHVRMIFAKCKSQKSLVGAFEEYVISRYKDARKLIDEVLEPYSAAYNTAVNALYESSENAQEINSNLRWLNKIDDADWLPATIVALTKYEGDDKFLIKFTAHMERLAAAMYLTSKTLNYRVDRYAAVLKSLEDGEKEKILQVLDLSQVEKNELSNILNGDVYHLPARKRTYTVTRLDSFVSDNAFKQVDSTVLTIEHVLPQNPAPGSEWLSLWPDADQRARWTHKIANLIPLTRKKNSQAQNYDFDIKKEKYFTGKYGTTSYALATQVLQCDKWTPEYVFERQHELLKVFSTEWDLDYIELVNDEISEDETAQEELTGTTDLINHETVKAQAAERIGTAYNLVLKREKESRYVNDGFAVHICSAGYNHKNKEYWYSVTPEILDWLSVRKMPYVAFAMGSADNLLMFSLDEIRSMLPNCLYSKKKDSHDVHHYHFAFVMRDMHKAFFKQKRPERMLVDVTSSLIETQ